MNTVLSKFEGTTNHELVHGGRLNMNFVDGHAKSMLWHIGFVHAGHFGPAVPYLFPKNSGDWSKWCANPAEEVSVPSGLRGNMTMPCGDVAKFYADSVSEWAAD
jgi:prepilin-type processing-associated H-X9-DG protein